MKNAVTFELTDKGDYTAIVENLENRTTIPSIPGRALMRGKPPMVFQTAFYAKGDSDITRNVNLKELIKSIDSEWRGLRPDPIPVMPDEVTIDMMNERYNSSYSIPLGISTVDVKTSYINLEEEYSLIISGDPGTGKSRIAIDICEMIMTRFDTSKVFAIDSDRNGLGVLAPKTSGYCVCDNEEELTGVLNTLVNTLNVRMNNKKQNPEAEFEMICIIVDDLKCFVEKASGENCDKLERICRLAAGLGVVVIACGRTDDVARYSDIETLTKAIINSRNGLALSGCPNDYLYFKNDLKYSEKTTEVAKGNALLFHDGICEAIKVMRNIL